VKLIKIPANYRYAEIGERITSGWAYLEKEKRKHPYWVLG
jgi:hypothetical protein